MGDHRSCCAAMTSTNRPRSRSLRWPCQSVPGARSRGGSHGEKLSSRFARVRVRVAHRDYWLADSRPEEWLLIEWPDGEKELKEPIKYWLSTVPENVAFRQLVDIAKLRWRIERDYQELKQEVGLGHFEGRGWRGFHHHATLCIAAYGFLISERETIPQEIVPPRSSRNLPYAKVTSPEDPPLRPERHVPNSIATIRRRLVAALATTLSRCHAAPPARRDRQRCSAQAATIEPIFDISRELLRAVLQSGSNRADEKN